MKARSGQTVSWVAKFYSVTSRALTDPTTVTIRSLNPSLVETEYVYGTDSEVTRDSTGIYRLTLQLVAAGDWYARAEGTGAVAAVEETETPVTVLASRFAGAEP